MLTIENVHKLEGWTFKDGEHVIERAFEWQDQYIFYIEGKGYSITPKRNVVSLSREWNNHSEQLYCLSTGAGKRIALGWTDIESKDRFALCIETLFN